MSPLEKEQLRLVFERFRRGEDAEASFRRVAEGLYRPLHRYFTRRGFGEEEGHDLTQETFVRIYRGAADFRRDARFETWVYAIAANVAHKTLRDRHALKRAPEEDALSLDDRPSEPEAPRQDSLGELIRSERLERLRSAVDRLPPKMRAVLKMSLYQDRSRQDIAEVLGVSPETVKAQLRQARLRLTRELADEDAPADTASVETP